MLSLLCQVGRSVYECWLGCAWTFLVPGRTCFALCCFYVLVNDASTKKQTSEFTLSV
jgi:hypothetical protein